MCDICRVWAILVSMFPSFPCYKEGTGGRGQIEPGPPVVKHSVSNGKRHVSNVNKRAKMFSVCAWTQIAVSFHAYRFSQDLIEP